MSPALRKPVALVLIVLLAIVWGVGDGLHWLPGLGHGVPVGNTVLWLGIEFPETCRSDDGKPRVEGAQDDEIPIYGEAECPICSVTGHRYTSAATVSFNHVEWLAQELPPAVLPVLPDPICHAFHARAPPLG
ncbi:MAG: hypothetical protein JW818_12285 [Pirellulales bacterium]|nr:hypothetical protein [Pirellulales bacterium]